jgi:hypothetical protein
MHSCQAAKQKKQQRLSKSWLLKVAWQLQKLQQQQQQQQRLQLWQQAMLQKQQQQQHQQMRLLHHQCML